VRVVLKEFPILRPGSVEAARVAVAVRIRINRILLESYYLPGQLEHNIGEFVEYYNNRRYHESPDNLTPADVYFRRAPAILKQREIIKRKTIEQRRRLHRQAIAA
jgi:putative transposase